jgi:segregation and condensation protein B
MNETNKNEIEDIEENENGEDNQPDNKVEDFSQSISEEAKLEEIDDTEAELDVLDDNEDELEELVDNEDELKVLDDNEAELDDNSIKEESIDLSKEDLEAQVAVLNRNLIEASLYASGKPLDVEELATKLEIPKKEVENLIQELALDYMDRPTALIINQVGEKYQMALRAEYVERVAKFSGGGGIAERYLRTLTVIALKQPILKSLVIKLRGTGAYEHVKYLIDNDLVSAVKKGRSDELTTTDKYSEMFGLPKNKEELKKVMIEQLGLETEQK